MNGKINPRLPKTLLKWINANPGKVCDADMGDGYSTESGLAYNFLLARGWCERGDYGLHTIIEPTVKDMLDKLRSIEPCKCDDCVTGRGW